MIAGVKVNGCTHFGRTALHAAVCKDRIHIVNLLLDAGATVHVYDTYSQTPVNIAKSYNSFQCEKRLRLMQLNLRGLKDSQAASVSIAPYRSNRISSTPHIIHHNNEALKRNLKPKATSAGANRGLLDSSSSNSCEPKKLLSARSDKSNNAIKSNAAGYWVISQHNTRPRELDGALERRYLNFLEHHDKLIHSKQYPLSGSKFQIIKFKKDSSEMIVGKPTVSEESRATHGRIRAPVIVNTVEEQTDTDNFVGSEVNHTPDIENPSSSSSPRQPVEGDGPIIRKSSLRSKSPQSPKRVRFSAKAR